MTYKDNFVVEVKCNGKILRVRDDAVYLPFGSEYSIYLKNLNSRKASVKIHVDGQDVLDFHSLILEPNSSTELEGAMGGTTVRNKFKFIKKTKQIQEHRGDKVDDGMIRVEFAFEKPKPETRQIITEKHEHHHHHYDYYHYWPRWTYTSNFDSGDTVYGSSVGKTSDNSGDISESDSMNISNSSGLSKGTMRACFSNVQMDSLGIESLGQPLDDEGITVKGSECYQQFRYGSIGELEQSKVIILRLKGMVDSGVTVEKPITTKYRLTCSTCGKKSRSSFKFCPDCGTFLE